MHMNGMSEKDAPLYNVGLWATSLMFSIVGVLLLMEVEMDFAMGIVALGGVVVLANNFFQYIGLSRPNRDERMAKIGTLATTYSWFIAMVVCMGALALLGFSEGRFDYGLGQVLGAVILAMAVSQVLINEVMLRREDTY
jgi:hypothetical protein